MTLTNKIYKLHLGAEIEITKKITKIIKMIYAP